MYNVYSIQIHIQVIIATKKKLIFANVCFICVGSYIFMQADVYSIYAWYIGKRCKESTFINKFNLEHIYRHILYTIYMLTSYIATFIICRYKAFKEILIAEIKIFFRLHVLRCCICYDML